MKIIKILKEDYPEILASLDKDEIKEITEENSIDPSYVASYIDDEWFEITGLTNNDKDEEGYFPGAVESILDDLDIDYDDFSQAWGSQREGADDWECPECEGPMEWYEYDEHGSCAECAKEECVECGDMFDKGDMYKSKDGLRCEDCEYPDDD